MTSVQLATLSTALWVVATAPLFIVLSEWSVGGSWGLTASIVRGVRGVRGWADQDPRAQTVTSPFVEALPPLLVPRRPIGGAAADGAPIGRSSTVDPQPSVEIVDLLERRVRH